MAGSRIDAFTEALREAVGGCFDVKARVWRDEDELRIYTPRRRGAAGIMVMDCGTAWEVCADGLGALSEYTDEPIWWWEDDDGRPLEPGFGEATSTAMDACINVARFGVARLRPRWQLIPLPGWHTTFDLDSDHALDDLLAAHPRHKLVKRWHPW